jgi:diacylglycerol kinase (ATP)
MITARRGENPRERKKQAMKGQATSRTGPREDPLVFIANPASGRGRAADLLGSLGPILRSKSVPFELHVTRRAGHAEELAASLGGRSRAVVAVGGDGTVHEVANGLRGHRCPLGFLAAGSGNDYARMFRTARSLEARVERLLEGTVSRVDVGVADGRIFVNSLGLGFEAEVTRCSRRIRRLRGLTLYLAAVFSALRSYDSPRIRLYLDRREGPEDRLLLVSVGNGKAVGGGFRLTPRARLDDQALDLCVVRHLPPLGVVASLAPALVGAHGLLPHVRMHRVRTLEVRADRPFPLHLDGELAGETRNLDVRLEPRALSVLADLEG